MLYWILRNKENKIISSGFADPPKGAEWQYDILMYNINDCYLQGTEFQVEVWKAIASIPVGETKTYKELVTIVGRGSPQAAGTACGRNKIPVVIPCHRVVGKSNPLAYSSGAEIKRRLLALEKIKV